MAGPLSQMDNTEVVKRVSAVEAQLRRKTGKTKGKMGLKREHVLAVIHSNADAQTIGKPRGDIVWMAVMELVATRRHVNADMFFKAEHTELLRARGLAAMGQRPEGTAHKVELTQPVSKWLKEDEEQKGGSGGVYVIRPGKWKQMKDAKKKLIARRGGVDALVATVTLLSAQGKATMQQRPNKPANKGKWDTWVEDSVKWMIQREWLTAEEAVGLSAKALSIAQQHEVSKYTTLVLNLGEGWRSVARGVEEVFPGARVVGADKRGFTWVGAIVGRITAELKHDWSTANTDLITALSKKAGVSVRAWSMIALEPECTLFSTANAMNMHDGTAHGPWALKPQNIANATPERVQDEVRQYEEAIRGVVIQLESLERHPYLAFIVENPADSELWSLPEVLKILKRNKDWVIREVDRCAYGREEQKPTKFLTNRPEWEPKGRTGNGRCCAGKCTGRLTRSGKTEHPSQTLANSKEKRVDCGKKVGGRREWNMKAVVNAIEREFIEEAYPIIMKSQESSPVGGSKRTTTTRDARGERSRKRQR